MHIFGIDGCKGGWFYVALNEKQHLYGITPLLKQLVSISSTQSQFYIDIPIGLKDEGEERLCDKESRKILGVGRGSSVFPSPTRRAVYAATYLEASEINNNLTGRKLSKQTWAITLKIEEIDSLLQETPDLRQRIREVHPELTFCALADNQPMSFSKRTKEGHEERIDVLKNAFSGTEALYNEIRAIYPKAILADDDILDAMASAIAASTSRHTLATIPAQPPLDSTGLPMEMVYPIAT